MRRSDTFSSIVSPSRTSASGRGQEVVERIAGHGGQAIFLECDVAREDAVRESIEKTVEHFGGLQSIINCAGIVHVAPLHEYSEQEWDLLMGVNFKSIFSRSSTAFPICARTNAATW
jgi:NAD(P)-dependent dehydrogenase (short-subunit alcohol dehydrogenase family)